MLQMQKSRAASLSGNPAKEKDWNTFPGPKERTYLPWLCTFIMLQKAFSLHGLYEWKREGRKKRLGGAFLSAIFFKNML